MRSEGQVSSSFKASIPHDSVFKTVRSLEAAAVGKSVDDEADCNRAVEASEADDEVTGTDCESIVVLLSVEAMHCKGLALETIDEG